MDKDTYRKKFVPRNSESASRQVVRVGFDLHVLRVTDANIFYRKDFNWLTRRLASFAIYGKQSNPGRG